MLHRHARRERGGARAAAARAECGCARAATRWWPEGNAVALAQPLELSAVALAQPPPEPSTRLGCQAQAACLADARPAAQRALDMSQG